MNRTIKKNIENIKIITDEIKQCAIEEDEGKILKLVSTFEKFPRKEVSSFYNVFFRDLNLCEKLISMAKYYINNDKILIEIISSLGNMVIRYGLPPSDDLYELFFSLRNRKKVNYYISLFILHFPQSESCDFRWDYILSIPDIAPKEKSKKNFYSIIKNINASGEKIPFEYKAKIVYLLGVFSDNNMYGEELMMLRAQLQSVD
ncbi:hypothetical protein D6S11_10270 [Salmonella enterica subsp. enterica]|nr:hypothetical protein [Salmonella enterica subsp. enterica serovar Isaszeg]